MKRSAKIMINLTPAKSIKRYNDTWNAFMEFTKERSTYQKWLSWIFRWFTFDHYYGHPIPWLITSSKLFTERKTPEIPKNITSEILRKRLLKEKLRIFITKEEISEDLTNTLDEKENIYRKTAPIVGYFGGLRCAQNSLT